MDRTEPGYLRLTVSNGPSDCNCGIAGCPDAPHEFEHSAEVLIVAVAEPDGMGGHNVSTYLQNTTQVQVAENIVLTAMGVLRLLDDRGLLEAALMAFNAVKTGQPIEFDEPQAN